VKVGLFLTGLDMTWSELLPLWLAADELGFDSAWMMDNVVGPLPVDPATGVSEAYTVLAAAAQATKRIHLGSLVTPVGRRHPALLAKMATTLDDISGGRFVLGLGVDDEPRHYVPWGMDYPAAAVRVSRVDEAIALMRRLWTEPVTSWSGQHYRLHSALLNPKPARTPPVWIGVVRPDNTRLLEIAGHYADGVNVFNSDDECLPRIRHAVEHFAAAYGRDPASLVWSRTIGVSFTDRIVDLESAVAEMARRAGRFGPDLEYHFSHLERHLAGPPEYCLERLGDEAELGFDEVIVHFSFDIEGYLRSAASQLDSIKIFGKEVLTGI
jgi:alkanesulfonate monooxygenase SsuD/methylene tetrahydromethanopterin reductase-like flavin-dependent oxidoreductase (luciferase family)